jgi:hypothetical protein
MPVSQQVQNFRLERASELTQFARVLKRIATCDPYPIDTAATMLRDFDYVPKVSQADPVNYDYWGYDVKNLTFYFENNPRHTYPENAINLSLSLSVKLIADFNDFQKIVDPYKHLEVNIVITGTYTTEGKSIELITSLQAHYRQHLKCVYLDEEK